MLKSSLQNIGETRIYDLTQLTKTFSLGIKSSDVITQKRVGIEFEKLAVLNGSYQAAPYSIVAKILSSLKTKHQKWSTPIYENSALLGLVSELCTLSLEPGAQTEISLVPMGEISNIQKNIDNYNKISAEIADTFGVRWLGYGIQPVSTYKNIHIIPKKRYEFMTKYLPTVGKKSLVMMRETSGIQASFDYCSEEDAIKKFSFALKLSPVISALFANSPIRNGKLTKYKSNRAASWLETDNNRCGLVSPKLFEKNYSENFSFEDYVQILLDVPMIFIEREINGIKKSIKLENITFRQFLKQGYQGFFALEKDWTTHISLYFSDVRFKSYIEIRNHDNQRSPLICSVPALWKGLIYNNDAMEAVLGIFKGLTYSDFEYLRNETPRYGLDINYKHLSMKYIVKEIVDLSYQSLKSFGDGEEKYLEPLKAFSDRGITPADVIIDKWNNEWCSDISKLIEYSKL